MIKAIRHKLINDPAVTAIIGDAVFDLVVPQDQPLPAVIYQATGGSDDLTQDGPDGFYLQQLRLTCLADGRQAVEQLTDKVIHAINGKRWTAEGEQVHLATVESIDDLPYQNQPGRDHRVRGKQLTVRVAWSTPAPGNP
jgi:hypothetical protein